MARILFPDEKLVWSNKEYRQASFALRTINNYRFFREDTDLEMHHICSKKDPIRVESIDFLMIFLLFLHKSMLEDHYFNNF